MTGGRRRRRRGGEGIDTRMRCRRDADAILPVGGLEGADRDSGRDLGRMTQLGTTQTTNDSPEPTFCWRHSLHARLTPGSRRLLVSGEPSGLSPCSASCSGSLWSWSALAGLLSMVLRLRLLGLPLPPFAPWLRTPAANSGLSMTDRQPAWGGGGNATVQSRASGFLFPETARDAVR